MIITSIVIVAIIIIIINLHTSSQYLARRLLTPRTAGASCLRPFPSDQSSTFMPITQCRKSRLPGTTIMICFPISPSSNKQVHTKKKCSREDPRQSYQTHLPAAHIPMPQRWKLTCLTQSQGTISPTSESPSMWNFSRIRNLWFWVGRRSS